MEHIDAKKLATDLPTRVAYLRKFIAFTKDDAAVLQLAAPVVAPLVPLIVDAVYAKLNSFDITWKAFVPLQSGQAADAGLPTKLEDVGLDSPQIKFRKDFLSNYLTKLVTMDYDDEKTWEYLDKVGIMHTGQNGLAHRYVHLRSPDECLSELGAMIDRKKLPALRVEYVHIGALLGYVEDVIISAVLGHEDIDLPTKTAVLQAVNKVCNKVVQSMNQNFERLHS